MIHYFLEPHGGADLWEQRFFLCCAADPENQERLGQALVELQAWHLSEEESLHWQHVHEGRVLDHPERRWTAAFSGAVGLEEATLFLIEGDSALPRPSGVELVDLTGHWDVEELGGALQQHPWLQGRCCWGVLEPTLLFGELYRVPKPDELLALRFALSAMERVEPPFFPKEGVYLSPYWSFRSEALRRALRRIGSEAAELDPPGQGSLAERLVRSGHLCTAQLGTLLVENGELEEESVSGFKVEAVDPWWSDRALPSLLNLGALPLAGRVAIDDPLALEKCELGGPGTWVRFRLQHHLTDPPVSVCLAYPPEAVEANLDRLAAHWSYVPRPRLRLPDSKPRSCPSLGTPEENCDLMVFGISRWPQPTIQVRARELAGTYEVAFFQESEPWFVGYLPRWRWRELLFHLQGASFWDLPVEDPEPRKLGGEDWFFAVRVGGRKHQVTRSCPTVTAWLEVCLELLAASGCPYELYYQE